MSIIVTCAVCRMTLESCRCPAGSSCWTVPSTTWPPFKSPNPTIDWDDFVRRWQEDQARISIPKTPEINAFGQLLAVEPFKQLSVEKNDVGGILLPGQKNQLTELKVVFGNDQIKAGWSVLVPAVNYTKYKSSYELNGQAFILIPQSEVLLVKRG